VPRSASVVPVRLIAIAMKAEEAAKCEALPAGRAKAKA